MKIKMILAICCLLLPWLSFAETSPELTEQEQYELWANTLWNSLDRQTGEIALKGNVAKLQVPDDFYYLNPADTEKVLVEIWGNPPGNPSLGMLFPADTTPFDAESWGVTIDYEQEGYVSDKDANDIDYNELLTQMKSDTRDNSNARVEQGYEPIELVGWAAAPFYNAETHKLYWAKEIKFGNADTNTLNYNIRVLGRKGVLVLNFIASMDQKAIIDSKLDNVLNIADFNEGSQYADFDPEIDEVAAYGLGALVAGKVVAKTGLIAGLIIFLKKFGIFIVLGIGALFKKLFSRKKSEV
ncbi:DUF2167 domain-containing protein [Shewanella woodyi]|uniref:Uncharacterized membrane-anchored protein-like protein n=1 Tax=Shewanella woodyi (strain ATCC 51908 / MS32) TaxID=392500 RepID=B1KIN2_SHEWM|nr:DUF2167 domain-containing protein [Shewanella woodyi]ACA88528.1 uncharacterized membrane-anchored protein-like protein [Shewanella woodyi ATCC 51908]